MGRKVLKYSRAIAGMGAAINVLVILPHVILIYRFECLWVDDDNISEVVCTHSCHKQSGDTEQDVESLCETWTVMPPTFLQQL